MRRSRGANGGGGVVAAGADRDEPALGPERVRDDEAVCACVAVQDVRRIDVVGFGSKSVIRRIWVVPARSEGTDTIRKTLPASWYGIVQNNNRVWPRNTMTLMGHTFLCITMAITGSGV